MNKKILMLLMFLLVMPLISALIYQQNETIDLKVPCTLDGYPCSASATCNITCQYPNATYLIENKEMTNLGTGDFNYSTNFIEIGEYQTKVSCQEGVQNATSTFTITITPTGYELSIVEGIVYISILTVLIILFIGLVYLGFKFEYVALKIGAWFSAYLILIAISFISWNLSLDYLANAGFLIAFFRIIFLFLLYALFPVILVTTFYTIYMMLKIKEIQNLVDKGIPYDEAYARTIKSGLRRIK